MTIMYPLKFGHMRLKHARLVTGAGWFVSIVLSAVPTFRLPYFGDAFFGSTGIVLYTTSPLLVHLLTHSLAHFFNNSLTGAVLIRIHNAHIGCLDVYV